MSDFEYADSQFGYGAAEKVIMYYVINSSIFLKQWSIYLIFNNISEINLLPCYFVKIWYRLKSDLNKYAFSMYMFIINMPFKSINNILTYLFSKVQILIRL